MGQARHQLARFQPTWRNNIYLVWPDPSPAGLAMSWPESSWPGPPKPAGLARLQPTAGSQTGIQQQDRHPAAAPTASSETDYVSRAAASAAAPMLPASLSHGFPSPSHSHSHSFFERRPAASRTGITTPAGIKTPAVRLASARSRTLAGS